MTVRVKVGFIYYCIQFILIYIPIALVLYCCGLLQDLTVKAIICRGVITYIVYFLLTDVFDIFIKY